MASSAMALFAFLAGTAIRNGLNKTRRSGMMIFLYDASRLFENKPLIKNKKSFWVPPF
ncbi:hypothetical protein [Novacetimonas hansenii]|uniref:hypothetical protein n=1 Tax=Novacetimonas hansenii TaxID=436 RepID=UPI000B2BE5BD|nr:hypothetical protein [Novacetimonas hansenii]